MQSANGDFFVRRIDLEPYFAAIKASPLVKITSLKMDKQSKHIIPEYDPSGFSPQIMHYCYHKGFYPICFDEIHDQLAIIINRDFGFDRYFGQKDDNEEEIKLDDKEIIMNLRENFGLYCPEFFSCLIPSTYAHKIVSVDNLEFKVEDGIIFDDLLTYASDPSKIDEYIKQKSIADSRDKGLFIEDSDSIAAEILDSVLTYAVLHRATDVHMEYTGEKYVARVRVDGDLQYYPKDLPSKYYAAMINVIRNRSDLDIAEHFKAQDGQMQFESQFVEKGKVSSAYDIRVSIIPDVNGRMSAVLRIQQKGEFKTLQQLGFNNTVYDNVQSLCKEPHGMILVTGPTGSGKTTTLYSILNELNKEDVKIITLEDPVEIKMVGITQVSVNEKQGRHFPNMLRHFLRHDPDIILVGEIRDIETAKLAISASNTGHLVLSTLHTNDAASTIKRLSNMEGIEPSEFAFALKGVCSQRLIKTFSNKIIDELPSDVSKRKAFLDHHGLFTIDVGNELNKSLGEAIFPTDKVFGLDGIKDNYEGRTAITEFWKLGTKAQDLIFDGKFSTSMLIDIAIKEDGMLPMPVTGMEKVVNFNTSLDNLIKVVGLDSIRQCRSLILDIFFS